MGQTNLTEVVGRIKANIDKGGEEHSAHVLRRVLDRSGDTLSSEGIINLRKALENDPRLQNDVCLAVAAKVLSTLGSTEGYPSGLSENFASDVKKQAADYYFFLRDKVFILGEGEWPAGDIRPDIFYTALREVLEHDKEADDG